MARYQVKIGTHYDEDGKKYTAGQVVESFFDLIAMFPEKFVKVADEPIVLARAKAPAAPAAPVAPPAAPTPPAPTEEPSLAPLNPTRPKASKKKASPSPAVPTPPREDFD